MRIICCIYKDFVRQLKASLPSFGHLCACEMSPGWGHFITRMDPSVGLLSGIFARVGGNLNNNFQKSQMPGGLPGGILKLRFDRCNMIRVESIISHHVTTGEECSNQPSLPPFCLWRSDKMKGYVYQLSLSCLLWGFAPSRNLCFEITSVLSHFFSPTPPLPFLYMPQSNTYC